MKRFSTILAVAIILVGVLILGATLRTQIEAASEVSAVSANQAQVTEAPVVETEAATQPEVEIVVGEVQQTQPTATAAPAATEEPVATEETEVVEETMESEVVADEEPVDPGLTEVTLKDGTTVMADLENDWRVYPTAAMRFEFDSKVISADNPRPENRYQPYDFELQPGEPILIFSEGTYTFQDGTTFKAIGGKGKDNLVFVTNTDTVTMTFQLSGYAATGFSVIHFAPGAEPNVELWARYGIGRPTHCGIAGLLQNGCSENTARDVTWSAGAADVQEFVYTESLPIDNTALTAGESNSDWASKMPAQAVQDEEFLRDQDPEVLGASANIGVTYSKPIILVCSSGTIEGPKGTQTTNMPAVDGMSYVVVLWNNVGNTAVYKGTGLANCVMYEYASGNVPHPELYARATIGYNGVTSSTLYVMTYDLLDALQVGTKVDEPTVFDQPLAAPAP